MPQDSAPAKIMAANDLHRRHLPDILGTIFGSKDIELSTNSLNVPKPSDTAQPNHVGGHASCALAVVIDSLDPRQLPPNPQHCACI